MLKRIFILSLWLASALFTNSAYARTPDISPGKDLLGLSAKSTEAEFRKKLGEPSGSINMGPDRHGLVYGQNVMLIFWKDRLWEARTWLVKGWTPELFHEWLQYVPETKKGFSEFTVERKFRIGERRREIEKAITGLEGDSDEFSIIVKKADTEIWFGFEYDDDVQYEKRDALDQKLVSLVVRFPDPK